MNSFERIRQVKLPISVDPCPIVESIIEIRFTSSLPEQAVFGVVYNQLKDQFPNFEQLSILQLPQAIRDQDPNLRYKPLYKAQKDNFIFQIGPRSFSLSNIDQYSGWETYAEFINSTYESILKSGVMNNIERIGLRYINVLENINIFENASISISLGNDAIIQKTNLSSEVAFDKGICMLRLTSDAETIIGGTNGKPVYGSVIDIDAITIPSNFDGVKEAIEYAHMIEKQLFFAILEDEFIKTLNPRY